ncbi:basic helix-loop-helix family protein [Dorcoceras hygrometricum]|uniref:Basic helix-loop-helix family protein n=1 Tax=Dorcoceras hygrometricum TaxID=472368 RepID=A0A2Z7B6F9_9LAMI|nr:basic helix-loop-helix family protein [Dorcoceras hygrometricum]
MALSNYSYWDTFHQFNAETTVFAQTEANEQLPSELQGCSDYLDFGDYVYSCNSTTDHLFNQHSMFYSSEINYDYLLPGHFQEVLPKRQKLAACGFQEYSLEVPVPPLPEYPPLMAPPVYRSYATCDGGGVKRQPATSGGSLSAQSIAARQRRRKITDKTQQLGKLIPGGQKMNTAEMFGAAHKYIKFLQAQVGILEFAVKSYDHQENKASSFPEEEEQHYLHGLLESPLIQEKLFSAEKCLVPKTFVQSLNIDYQSS